MSVLVALLEASITYTMILLTPNDRRLLTAVVFIVWQLIMLRYAVFDQFKKHDEDLRSELVKLRELAEKLLSRKE